MINYEIIDKLVGTEKGARTRFTNHVYGEKGNKGFEKSFKNVNPRFDTCERIADYLHISLDQLRVLPVTDMAYPQITGDFNNNSGNITIGSDLERENAYLKKELASQKALLEAKDETISTLKDLIEAIRSSKEESICLYERYQTSDANSEQSR